MSHDEKILTIIGGAIVSLLSYIGYEIRKTDKEIRQFPEKYVLKDDYKEDQREIKEELRGMRKDVKHGLERIHDRLDKK